MSENERLVREAFESVIQAQVCKLDAMKTQFAQLHKMPKEKIIFRLQAEGRVKISTKFAK